MTEESNLMVRVLVVDDEPDLEILIRQKFRRKIRSKEMEFLFAENGARALEVLAKDSAIDVVMTDINMPVMDGLTLLTKIAESSPLLRAIVVSAYGDMSNIRTAMNRGAFDFVTKPIDFEDLSITIDKTVLQTRAMRRAAETHNRLDVLEKELGVARRLQQSILPHSFAGCPEVDVQAAMVPARQVGGDFYDYFLLDEHRLGVVIADVSGKGIAAALFMAITRTELKSTAHQGLDTATCLQRVNNILEQGNEAAMFVTVFYAIVDLRNGEVDYCNAGHNPSYILRTDSSLQVVAGGENMALGYLPNQEYKSHTLQLHKGDTLFLYTDGITEAVNEAQEFYGEERLENVLRIQTATAPRDLCDTVLTSVQGHSARVAQHDDITLLALRYQP